jgi:hypothetical protein
MTMLQQLLLLQQQLAKYGTVMLPHPLDSHTACFLPLFADEGLTEGLSLQGFNRGSSDSKDHSLRGNAQWI